ncbi:winged helix-turn-helix domain-containing protein, partial [Candidatus Pelagibacter sp.]|uniref:winged helix-turn-helix domain-containing protein n=1 Tax=Candidatus Pelagibacter sp. TaxID=2024849 RepID=UPI003F8704EE
VPSKIDKIIEQINVFFLSNQFSNQSNIQVGEYILDLNSRVIIRNQDKLNLTEKEIELILYIKTNSPVSLKKLQQKVWNHVSDLESHTVETHIYRLRKKFLETFKDNNFIIFEKKGYYLS